MYGLSVDETLRLYAGKTAFLAAFAGNNGDTLISLGAREQMKRQTVHLTDQPKKADVLVLVGGGMMTDPHGGREWLARMARSFADKDLVLLPSSFSHASVGPSLEGRGANTYIFARDEGSLEALLAMSLPGGMNLGLDHDSSLSLEDSDLIRDLRRRSQLKHILIVERTDIESYTGHKEFWAFLERRAPGPLLLVPQPIRRAIRTVLVVPRRLTLGAQMRANALTPYSRAALERVLRDYPKLTRSSLIALDISQTSVCDFPAFCSYVAEAALVVSNRLHVAVLAALLGKPTYLDCGARKPRDVYAHSLARFQNIRLL